MFIHAIPDNRGNKDGCYCSLVESHRTNGVSAHRTVLSFGFIHSDRVPYLKAAFNRGNPENILESAKRSQENRRGQKL
jgi:hypothetical protein